MYSQRHQGGSIHWTGLKDWIRCPLLPGQFIPNKFKKLLWRTDRTRTRSHWVTREHTGGTMWETLCMKVFTKEWKESGLWKNVNAKIWIVVVVKTKLKKNRIHPMENFLAYNFFKLSGRLYETLISPAFKSNRNNMFLIGQWSQHLRSRVVNRLLGHKARHLRGPTKRLPRDWWGQSTPSSWANLVQQKSMECPHSRFHRAGMERV